MIREQMSFMGPFKIKMYPLMMKLIPKWKMTTANKKNRKFVQKQNDNRRP